MKEDISEKEFNNYINNIDHILNMISTPYEKMVFNIKDQEIKDLFKETTEPIKNKINNHALNIMNIFATHKFSEIDFSGYLKFAFWSEPCCWILFLKDEDFLKFLESKWNDILELYKICQNKLKEKESDDICCKLNYDSDDELDKELDKELENELENEIDKELEDELEELSNDSIERRSSLIAIKVIEIFVNKYSDRFRIL